MSLITIEWSARPRTDADDFVPSWRLRPTTPLDLRDLKARPQHVDWLNSLRITTMSQLQLGQEVYATEDEAVRAAHRQALTVTLRRLIWLSTAGTRDTVPHWQVFQPRGPSGLTVVPLMGPFGPTLDLVSMSGARWFGTYPSLEEAECAIAETTAAESLMASLTGRLRQWRQLEPTFVLRDYSTFHRGEKERVDHTLRNIALHSINEFYQSPHLPNRRPFRQVSLKYDSGYGPDVQSSVARFAGEEPVLLTYPGVLDFSQYPQAQQTAPSWHPSWDVMRPPSASSRSASPEKDHERSSVAAHQTELTEVDQRQSSAQDPGRSDEQESLAGQFA